jgi:hypothetical protein
VVVYSECLVDVRRAEDFRYFNDIQVCFHSTDALLAQEPFLVIGYLDKF